MKGTDVQQKFFNYLDDLKRDFTEDTEGEASEDFTSHSAGRPRTESVSSEQFNATFNLESVDPTFDHSTCCERRERRLIEECTNAKAKYVNLRKKYHKALDKLEAWDKNQRSRLQAIEETLKDLKSYGKDASLTKADVVSNVASSLKDIAMLNKPSRRDHGKGFEADGNESDVKEVKDVRQAHTPHSKATSRKRKEITSNESSDKEQTVAKVPPTKSTNKVDESSKGKNFQEVRSHHKKKSTDLGRPPKVETAQVEQHIVPATKKSSPTAVKSVEQSTSEKGSDEMSIDDVRRAKKSRRAIGLTARDKKAVRDEVYGWFVDGEKVLEPTNVDYMYEVINERVGGLGDETLLLVTCFRAYIKYDTFFDAQSKRVVLSEENRLPRKFEIFITCVVLLYKSVDFMNDTVMTLSDSEDLDGNCFPSIRATGSPTPKDGDAVFDVFSKFFINYNLLMSNLAGNDTKTVSHTDVDLFEYMLISLFYCGKKGPLKPPVTMQWRFRKLYEADYVSYGYIGVAISDENKVRDIASLLFPEESNASRGARRVVNQYFSQKGSFYTINN